MKRSSRLSAIGFISSRFHPCCTTQAASAERISSPWPVEKATNEQRPVVPASTGRSSRRSTKFAAVNNNHAAAGHVDLGQNMRGEENRRAAGERADKIADFDDLARIEADG